MIFSKVKLNKKLNQDILKTVRNYNAKIYRLKNSGKTNIYIPKKIKVSDFKTADTSSEFYSYNNQELRQHLRDLKRFLKRGSEEYTKTKSGITISKYEKEILQNRRRRVLKKLRNELEDYGRLHLSELGVPEPFSFKELGDLKYRNMLARKKYLEENSLSNIGKNKLGYYKKFLGNYSKPSRNDLWKANYMEILKINGRNLGIDDEIINNVVSNLEKLSAYEFKVAFDTDKHLQAVYDYYLGWKAGTISDESISNAKDYYIELSENIELVVNNAREVASSGRIKY